MPFDTPATTIEVESLGDWAGQDVLDPKGDRLGRLEAILYDAETDVPMFATVRRGRLGKRVTLVPLHGASVGRSFLRVARDKETLKKAPQYDPATELSIEDEAEAYAFYELPYATTGQGARRLARR